MEKLLNKDEIIKKMTLKEKAMFLSGSSPMHNYGVERLNIPSLSLNDGPNGLRRIKNDGDSLGGVSQTEKSTVFPCSAMLASSWNNELIKEVGDAIGKECVFYKTDVLLGPAVNIKRNPLCGRNFEYYSEDPFLAGNIASYFIKGVESNNVGACVKHFACNNNEKFRFIGNSKVDDRALHEIYLKPYEIILKNSNISCFMASYNQINDEYCSQNSSILVDFLRKEHGFKGVIMTDWGGIVDRVKGIKNTLDLEMPGEVNHNINYLIDSVKNNTLDEKIVDESVGRMIDLYNKTLYVDKENFDSSIFEKNYEIALKAAEEGIVLLKNERNILPFNKDKKLLIVGDLFNNIRFQGSGSSLLDPIKFKGIKEAFDENKVNYKFLKGYDQYDESSLKELEELRKNLNNNNNKYESILLFVGQSDFVESEGFDRENLRLPEIQLKVIEEFNKFNYPVVIVFASGSVIELPFKDKVEGIVDIFLGGEAIGEALYNVLFGKVSPSGKLVETFVNKYEDISFGNEFAKNIISYYKESIFVGYRYYDTFKKEVAYPFGYGLSYSTFEYANLNVLNVEEEIVVKFDLKNCGNYDAKEVVEVYVGKKNSSIYRASKELKAYKKVFLNKGETKNIVLSISLDDLKIYNPLAKSWVLEDGEYEIYVSKNIKDICLKDKINIKGEKIENSGNLKDLNEIYQNFEKIKDKNFAELFNLKYLENEEYGKPYTMETPIYALNSFMGKIFRASVLYVGKKQIKKAKRIKDPIQKSRQMKAGVFVKKLMPVNTLRSLCFSSSGNLKYNIALGLLEMINGHYLKGLKYIIKKEVIKDEK